jgi:hypothetical protein
MMGLELLHYHSQALSHPLYPVKRMALLELQHSAFGHSVLLQPL